MDWYSSCLTIYIIKWQAFTGRRHYSMFCLWNLTSYKSAFSMDVVGALRQSYAPFNWQLDVKWSLSCRKYSVHERRILLVSLSVQIMITVLIWNSQTLDDIGVVPYAKWSSVYRLFFWQKLDEFLFVYFFIISECGHRLGSDVIKSHVQYDPNLVQLT